MKPEAIVMFVASMGALILVVLNDLSKRRLVDKARRQNRTIRKDLLNNKTQWGMVVVLVIGLAVYAILLSYPELRKMDFGPLTPIADWFFKEPP